MVGKHVPKSSWGLKCNADPHQCAQNKACGKSTVASVRSHRSRHEPLRTFWGVILTPGATPLQLPCRLAFSSGRPTLWPAHAVICRWLQDQLPPEVASRCYFFNTFFFKKLMETSGERLHSRRLLVGRAHACCEHAAWSLCSVTPGGDCLQPAPGTRHPGSPDRMLGGCAVEHITWRQHHVPVSCPVFRRRQPVRGGRGVRQADWGQGGEVADAAQPPEGQEMDQGVWVWASPGVVGGQVVRRSVGAGWGNPGWAGPLTGEGSPWRGMLPRQHGPGAMHASACCRASAAAMWMARGKQQSHCALVAQPTGS